MARLIVEWSTDDEDLARTLRRIAEFPERSLERMELEATLHMFEAQRLMREIGYRQGERAAMDRTSRRNRSA